LQRTALCADKIVAILKAGIGSIAFPIYDCAAAEAQAVRRPGYVVDIPFFDMIKRIGLPEGASCPSVVPVLVVPGVVRTPVVRIARCAGYGRNAGCAERPL